MNSVLVCSNALGKIQYGVVSLGSLAMRVFAFGDGQDEPPATELSREPVDSEWQLESWLHVNPEVILDERLLIFGRQYGLDTGIPDLLALDQWGNVVVVELKKGQSGSGSASEETILSQPQNYASDLSSYEYSDLEDIYREYKTNVRGEWEVSESAVIEDTLKDAHDTALGGGVDESEFNAHQRMVILAEEITSRTENNARYLLEQGLAVQCVSVQRFLRTDEGPTDQSLLVSSTVVDYPRARIQPEDDTVDYSDLILKVRDGVYSQVAEMTRHDEPAEMSGAASRQFGFASQHPDHPTTVRYRFKPRMVEEGKAVVCIGLWGSDEDEKEQVREVTSASAGQVDFETSDDHKPNKEVVYTEFEKRSHDADEEFVEMITDEMIQMVEHYHPRLVDEVQD